MATVRQIFDARQGVLAATTFPERVKRAGTNFPLYIARFATGEKMYFLVRAAAYGSGNITAKVGWYAENATTGNCNWGARIAAQTPGDAESVEAAGFGTQATTATAANGTSKGPVETSITISSLDSVAAGDWFWLEIERVATSDTMSNDADFFALELSYSDT